MCVSRVCAMGVLEVVAAIILLACGSQAENLNVHEGKQANWGSRGVPHPRCATLKRKRTGDLGEELVYDRYWNGLYRIPRQEFENLLDSVYPLLIKDFQKQVNASGAAVSPRTNLSMTLCYLGGGRVWDIVVMHHVSTGLFYNSNLETIRAINISVAIPGIPFDDKAELDRLAAGFKKASGGVFDGCVGAIDGLAIRIRCPRFAANPTSYYNRKHYYSMNLQAVCDADLVIRYYSLKTAGATHDSLAWDVSDLHMQMKTGKLPKGYWIVGDDAYPNTEYLSTPYSGRNISSRKSNYNFFCSKMRCAIERCFGVFVVRWQIFQRAILQEPDEATEIVACCIRLHNICMQARANVPLEGAGAYEEQQHVADANVVVPRLDTKLRAELVDLVEELGFVRPY